MKAFATKAWPYFRRMQGFMPGTQPRGTHAFDPSSLSSHSATQIINAVNAEEDEEEDRLGVDFLDSAMDNTPAVPAWPPFVNSDLGNSSSSQIPSNVSSSFSPPNPSASSSSDARPPPFSSLPPSVHTQSTPDASMGPHIPVVTLVKNVSALQNL
jgi:hypothetical protein